MVLIKRIAYLHNHSVYSVKDGFAKTKDYAKKIQEFKDQGIEVSGFALTEHGNLYSMVKAQNDLSSVTNTIVGNEIYFCKDVNTSPKDERFHMILLAKNSDGLKNLYKITSHSGMNAVITSIKKYQRTDENFLRDNGKGIIALSGCVQGIIPNLIINGQYEAAKNKALEFASFFDEFYLEIQPHDFPNQLLVNSDLCKISKETGIPIVITTDTHYVNKEDMTYHKLMYDMSRNPHPYHNTLCDLKSYDEIYEYCLKYNIPIEAIENTNIIADKCIAEPKPKDSRGLLPEFKVPVNHTEESYLREICFKNFYKFAMEKKFTNFKLRMDRLNEELDVICSLGFAGYFLILWDWFAECRNRDILTGKGRGSAAGSYVSYLLSITTVDPIKFDFIFSRFLNFERAEFPDIDSDIATDRRAEGIGYLLDKYGKEHVAQIVSFTKYNVKNTARAVASALFDSAILDEVTEMNKKIPNVLGTEPVTYEILEKIYKDPSKFPDMSSKDINSAIRAYDALQELFKKYPSFYEAVSRLNGCISNEGLHAGGVVISSKPLQENLPIMDISDSSILPLVQLEMEDLDYFKALKVDVLGLNTLSQIKKCMDMVGLDYSWFDSEDYEDPAVYEMLRRGETTDVFQFASPSATKMLVEMQPDKFEDLITHNAGNRPGPQKKNKTTGKSMWDLYLERRRSGVVPSLHEKIDKILKPTLGCIW